MLEKLHVIIALIGALIVTIVCMIFKVDFFSLCVTLIVVIIVFFLLGLYLRNVIQKAFSEDEIVNDDDNDNDNDDHIVEDMDFVNTDEELIDDD